jgi:hypothetical protein
MLVLDTIESWQQGMAAHGRLPPGLTEFKTIARNL